MALSLDASVGTGRVSFAGRLEPPFDVSGSLAVKIEELLAALPDATAREKVKVAVIDSPIDISHPDLQANVNRSLFRDFQDPNQKEGSTSVPAAKHYHGTHVAGIIGATAANGQGVAGAAAGFANQFVEIVPVNIFIQGDAPYYYQDTALTSLLNALAWVKEQGVKVVNLSLGTQANAANIPALGNAVNSLVAAGVTVVAAAGNNNSAEPVQPASYASAIGVINLRNVNYELNVNPRANMSNYNSDYISAPGEGIYSTYYPNNGYAMLSGTSMAAPMVASAAALLYYAKPDLTPAQIRAILAGAATDVHTQGQDEETGYGALNMEAAVDKVLPPSVPVGLAWDSAAYALTHNPIALSWNADAGVDGYRIYRAVGSGSYTLLADAVADAYYTDPIDTAAAQTYHYRVAAYKGATVLSESFTLESAPSAALSFSAAGGAVYNANQTILCAVTGAPVVYSAPAGLRELLPFAFSGLGSLQAAELGQVQTVGAGAFTDCSGLKLLLLPAAAPTVDTNAFSNAPSGLVLLVPQGAAGYDSLAAYPAGTTVKTYQVSFSPASPSAGDELALTVALDGVTAYQWKKDGVSLGSVSGANSAAYALTEASTADSGAYSCAVTINGATVTLPAVAVTVKDAAAPPAGNPGGGGGGGAIPPPEPKAEEKPAPELILPIGRLETVYTLDETGLASVVLTAEQTAAIIAATPGSNITFDFSEVADASALAAEFDPLWFSQANKQVVLESSLCSVTLNQAALTRLGGLSRGPVRLAAKTGAPSLAPAGALELSITRNGRALDWYGYEYPLLISMPLRFSAGEGNIGPTLLVNRADGSAVPRSWEQGGVLYAKVYQGGSYDARGAYIENFTDMETHWARAAVNELTPRGVISGVGDGRFEPDANVTRGQFIAMLMRLCGVNAAAVETFSDVPAGHGFYTEVNAARALGVTSGVGGNRFSPDAVITRQELFATLHNAMKALNLLPAVPPPGGASFADADAIASWARTQIGDLAALGLINGVEGRVKPNGTATRAEAAQALYSLLLWDRSY
jgi:hypothetical protein